MERIYLETVDSTNRWAKENITEINDRTVVYTYSQTSGRGRLNRKWTDIGSDNIYASIVLKPSKQMKDVYSNLTQYLCVVLAQTFEEYGVAAEIKWPNDIKINNKKISGILAEGVNRGNELLGIVLGVGINLNAKQEIVNNIDQPATALNLETNMQIDKETFMNKLLERFCLLYDSFIEVGFPLIRDEYKKRVNFLNKQVTVTVFDKVVSGIATDITDNGALEIVDKNNKKQILLIGDIL